MAIQAFVVTPFCCLVSYSQPFLPVFVHFILRSYVSKSFSFSLDFRSFKFHLLLWEPGGPMQLVLMTSCLASLFLTSLFLFASVHKEVSVHSSWYLLHISLLASQRHRAKDKGCGRSIGKPFDGCPKDQRYGILLVSTRRCGRKWEKDLGTVETGI